jgi:hypothetical protein
VAVSDTTVPWLYIPPEGLTVPEPFPAVDTVNAYCFKLKVAVTFFGASIITLQVVFPEQAPDQPLNTELAAGAAVSATVVPWLYIHPGGLTVPDPFPPIETLNAYCFKLKVAVTLLAASIVTLQAPVPEQTPDQPPN